MSRYEAFPDLEPVDMCDDELADFVSSSIWPAANHIWDDAYKDPERALYVEDRTATIPSEYGAGTGIELSFSTEVLAHVDDDGEVDETRQPEIYVRVALNSKRADLTRHFDKKFTSCGVEIWESCVYDFYLDGLMHEADRYYSLKDNEGEDLDYDELSPPQRKEITRVSSHPKYDLDRSAEITTQDIIDVKNILLALDIPEDVISV
jgi:hypothetical protein